MGCWQVCQPMQRKQNLRPSQQHHQQQQQEMV
jgi:hypothetical protein